MREGWEYKKLGEVCTIERGGSPRPIADFVTESSDGINWIKIGDAIEGSKYILSTKEKIKPEGRKKSRYVHKGDFILSNSMSFGKPYILGIDGCIHDGWLVLHDKNNTFSKDYLYYVLSSPIMYSKFTQLAVGGVVNNLNSNLVRDVIVAIPTISTQRSIASELDMITEMISKYDEQLKELDKLSQSIFYEMFGDPVENEKGWEERRIDSICNVTSSKRILVEDMTNTGIPFLRGTELTLLSTGYEFDEIEYPLNISQKQYEKVKEITGVPEVGDILIPSINSNGYVWIVNTSKQFYFKDGRVIWIHVNKDLFCSEYLRYLLMIQLRGEFEKMNGATFAEFKLFVIREMIVMCPPLPLQQSFARKIEAIEAMKSKVKEAKKEAETLLAARMQYWFE